MFVVVKATNEYVSGCFAEYPWHPDPTKQYAALYRPYHYVGLELGISIANAALRGVATGAPKGFFGDVVATAKKDLAAGEVLDGEGGYAVWGKLISARASVARRALPIALAHHVELRRDVAKGSIVTWDDVDLDGRVRPGTRTAARDRAAARAAVTVSLLGLGPMGAPMAANLVRGLGALTVWNRTPEKAAALVDMGARSAVSPAEAAPTSCSRCCRDLPQVTAVLEGAEGLLAGWRARGVGDPTLVVHGTVSPVAMRDLAADLRREHGSASSTPR